MADDWRKIAKDLEDVMTGLALEPGSPRAHQKNAATNPPPRREIIDDSSIFGQSFNHTPNHILNHNSNHNLKLWFILWLNLWFNYGLNYGLVFRPCTLH